MLFGTVSATKGEQQWCSSTGSRHHKCFVVALDWFMAAWTGRMGPAGAAAAAAAAAEAEMKLEASDTVTQIHTLWRKPEGSKKRRPVESKEL